MSRLEQTKYFAEGEKSISFHWCHCSKINNLFKSQDIGKKLILTKDHLKYCLKNEPDDNYLIMLVVVIFGIS